MNMDRKGVSLADVPLDMPRRAASRRWLGLASPLRARALAESLLPPLYWLAAVFGLAGLAAGFLLAPTDAQQGEAYRILYLHVPAAWMSMLVYLAMAFWSLLSLVLNTRASAMMALALAPTGALLPFLALARGAIWGRPPWGAWWVWDARLTSELLLLFLYLGYLGLHNAFDDARRADRAAALLALVGVINLPVIYFSVVWWNTLHQGASLGPAGARMDTLMLIALLLMTAAFWCYTAAAALTRFSCIVLEREADREES